MIISLFICIIFVIYARSKRLGVIHPISAFFLLWTLIVGMYSLNLGDIIPPSFYVEMIYAVGLLCWGIGAVMAENRKVKSENSSIVAYSFSVRYWIAVIVCWYIMGLVALKSIPFIIAGTTLGEIRYEMREEILGGLTIPFIYLAQPLSLLIIHFSALNILKREKLLLSALSVLVTVILSEFCIGGRFVIYYVIIDFLFIVVVIQKQQFPFLKDKRWKLGFFAKISMVAVFSILLTAIILITGPDKVLETIYSYFSGCIKLLDVKISEFSRTENYTLGFSSFNGFFRPFFVSLRSLGVIDDLPQIAQHAEENLLLVEEKTQDAFKSAGTYNGFVSLFYYFYVDFGFLGIIFMSALWGYICVLFYKKMKSSGTDRSIMIYLLILQAIAISMTRFAFSFYQYALVFIYLFFVFEFNKRKSIIRKNETSSIIPR